MQHNTDPHSKTQESRERSMKQKKWRNKGRAEDLLLDAEWRSSDVGHLPVKVGKWIGGGGRGEQQGQAQQE